jgi:upstream activation factor subunit UAF30
MSLSISNKKKSHFNVEASLKHELKHLFPKQLKKEIIRLIIMVKKTKTKQTTSVVSKKPQVVEAPPVPTVVAVAPVAEVASVPSSDDDFTKLIAQLVALRTQLTSLTSATRALQKRSERELKVAYKASRKRSKKGGPKQPSGFTKPALISMDLASFIGKPEGTLIARTDVTKILQQYILKHSLQNPKNGRHILADKKLQKLLKMKNDDKLTYFNLQAYMKPHFATGGNPPAADQM